MGLWRSSVKYILVFIENVEAIFAEFKCSMFDKNEYLKHKRTDSVLSENITILCKIEDRLRQT